jgi:hypothetical protein
MILRSAEQTSEAVDVGLIDEKLARLNGIIDEAKAIARGASAARRGIAQVEEGYARLRASALDVIAEISGLLLSTAE